MGNRGTGNLIVALVSAGIMLLLVMLVMPTIQPTLVDIATVITSMFSADADWAADFANNTVIPLLPIALPIVTFIGVYIRVSSGNRMI